MRDSSGPRIRTLSGLCKPVSARAPIPAWGMRMKSTMTMAALGACAALMAGCAAVDSANPSAADTLAVKTTAQSPDQPASRADKVAEKLAQAERAYDSGDTQRLTSLLATLNAIGVKSFDDAQADTLAMWQSASGVEPPPFRGRLLGPAYVRGELAPGEVWRSAQTFKSGEASTLSVSHKGSGPVRMTVSDRKARAVCTPRRMKEPACRFTPLFTQRYDIELTNEGTEDAVYFLVFD